MTFVANRLPFIYDGSKPSQWNFVDSNRNPADDASRGLTVEKLLSQDRWLQGPKFLWGAVGEEPGLIPRDAPQGINAVKNGGRMFLFFFFFFFIVVAKGNV